LHEGTQKLKMCFDSEKTSSVPKSLHRTPL
jgi:hypothetical protein